MRCTDARRDPGPCPVDDTPHTGCVAPAAGAALVSRTAIDQTVAVAVQRPGWLRAPVAAPAAVPEHAVVATFTTGTYKRAEHGRRAFGKGTRGGRV